MFTLYVQTARVPVEVVEHFKDNVDLIKFRCPSGFRDNFRTIKKAYEKKTRLSMSLSTGPTLGDLVHIKGRIRMVDSEGIRVGGFFVEIEKNGAMFFKGEKAVRVNGVELTQELLGRSLDIT